MKVKYSSNNSGGFWWLKDEDWFNLEANGWTVEWMRDNPNYRAGEDGRYLGALAWYAYKEFPTIEMAEAEFEWITGQDPLEEGCYCCGQPHNFYEDIEY